MSAINFKLYDLLKTEFKLSDEKAKDFATILQERIDEEINNKSTLYKSEIREDMLKVEMHLKGEIKDSKVDTIKWMFAFWIGQVAVLAGILMYFLKK